MTGSQRAAGPRSLRGRTAELSLLAVSLAVALVAANLSAVWLLSRPPQLYPIARFPRDRVKNSGGFRDYEYPEEKGPGVFRVLAIGDSFTYGGGINLDDAWPKRLERYLTQYRYAPGRRFQVLNLGVPGTGTAQQAAAVRAQAARWRPDLIVLACCLNDAEDPGNRAGLMALRRRTWDVDLDATGIGAWIAGNWTLYRLVRQRLHNARVNRGHLDYFHALYEKDYPGWGKMGNAVADLGAFSRESGIPVAAMIFPLFSWDLDEDYPFKTEHAEVNALFRKAGVATLDLRAAYRGLNHTALEAVPFVDPHPSDVAQRIAAERLFVFLDKKGLLPKDEPRGDGRRVPPPWQ